LRSLPPAGYRSACLQTKEGIAGENKEVSLPFIVSPLPASFGAVVTDIGLTELDDDQFRLLYDRWLDHGLLIFPDQNLDKDQQIAFARRFGPLEVEWGELSNVQPDGTLRSAEPGAEDGMMKAIKGNMGWHQDSTFMPVQAKGAVFSAITVPDSGGETGFADMEAAYTALSEAEQQRLEGMSALHSLTYSQTQAGFGKEEGNSPYTYGFDVAEIPRRPLVKIHPETGRKSLAIGRHGYDVTGLDDKESQSFLEGLRDTACQPPRIWAHRWNPGDIIVWDNRRLLHRSMPWDMRQPRVMWHTRLAGDPASERGLT
jgi:alpha-ketoglutarate-dependent taurine dioxygenase